MDESLTVPRPPGDGDDPIIEYEDEFGRIRTARRSEVPRELLPRDDADNQDSDEDLVIYNPVNHYPIYKPSEERMAEIEREFAEENNPLNVHYDASQEVRAKGAGFYQFSGDEETRRKQMEELKAAREETEKTRKETGAVDILPGEVEGMQETSTKSRAMEKRKREIEERRKMLEERRKKPKTAHAEGSKHPSPVPKTSEQPRSQGEEVDPFSVLESTSGAVPKPIKKSIPKASSNTDADAFLAQLHQDFLKSKKTR